MGILKRFPARDEAPVARLPTPVLPCLVRHQQGGNFLNEKTRQPRFPRSGIACILETRVANYWIVEGVEFLAKDAFS